MFHIDVLHGCLPTTARCVHCVLFTRVGQDNGTRLFTQSIRENRLVRHGFGHVTSPKQHELGQSSFCFHSTTALQNTRANQTLKHLSVVPTNYNQSIAYSSSDQRSHSSGVSTVEYHLQGGHPVQSTQNKFPLHRMLNTLLKPVENSFVCPRVLEKQPNLP